MKLVAAGFFSLLLVLCFSSCQRELDIDPNNPPPPGSGNDSIYLSKAVSFDTTLPQGQDTLFVTNFFYDSRKRLTHYTFAEFNSALNQTGELKYHYNGNDSLPYKMTMITRENGIASVLDTVFYSYASNGLVSKDSMRTYIAGTNEVETETATSYTVNGNNVIIKGHFTNYLGGTPITDQYVGTANLVMSNGDIVLQTSPSDITSYEYFQVSYVDHPDPFYRIDVHYPVLASINNIAFDSQKKLFATQDVGIGPTNTIVAKYRNSYVYRPDGYPIIAREIDLLEPTYNYKVLFFYTHL